MIETDEKAKSIPVQLSDGSAVRLGDLWQKKPLILVFLRHFG